MNELFQALFALLAALTSTGAPAVNPVTLPAKPIVAPAPAGILAKQDVAPTETPEPRVEITGTIQSVTGTTVLLDKDITVTLGMEAEVKGDLQPGAVVKIEGKLQADGSIVASKIQAGAADMSKISDKGLGDAKNGDKGKGDDKTQVLGSVDPSKAKDISPDKAKTQSVSSDPAKSQDNSDKNKSQGSVDPSKSQSSADPSKSHDTPDKSGSEQHDAPGK